MKRKIMSTRDYRGYELYEGHQDETFNTKTLDQVIDSIEGMCEKHSKVLATRLDIHSPQDTDTPLTTRDITRIIENTKRNINNRSKSCKNKPDIHNVWTQERTSEEKHPHYHLQFYANGNAIQNGYKLFKEVQKQVQRRAHTENEGLVHFCESNGETGVFIDRNREDFEQQKAKAVQIGSYLAKTRTKELNPKGSRVSSSSFFPRTSKNQD